MVCAITIEILKIFLEYSYEQLYMIIYIIPNPVDGLYVPVTKANLTMVVLL